MSMDYTLEDTIYIEFTTRSFSTGAPTVLAGTPVVSWSENGGVNNATGVTLTVSLNSVVGNNLLTIAATAANGFENGKDYNLKITTGTVGGVSVVGEVVGKFSIGRSAAAVDLANGTDGLGAIKADTAAIKTKTDFQPSITAGAAGGLFIAGTNAATTITAGSNDSALTLNGSGTGSGLEANGGDGTLGNGITASGGAGISSGIYAIAGDAIGSNDLGAITASAPAGGGHGFLSTTSAAGFSGIAGLAVGATGFGLLFSGETSGARMIGTTNGIGLEVIGQGVGDGMVVTGGATGDALVLTGGSTSGGALVTNVTSGAHLDADIQAEISAAVWAEATRTLTAATNITSDGSAINVSSGVVDTVNLTNTTTTNTDMRGTDSALLAASAPTNWSSLVISGGGAVDSLMQGFLNTVVTESTAGRIAGNFGVFYDNADAVTTKTVDNVGGGGGGGDATEAKQDTIIGHLTDIKGAGWTTTDTLEAIRDRGDAAWLTATGFSTHSATDVWSAATRTLTAATNITSDGSAINVSSGVVDTVNLTNTTTTNTDMRGTDSALLAASAPTNWSSLVISGGGAVDSLMQGFLNTVVTESTAGRIAGNFGVFYDNADAVTTKTIDDVGGGGGGGGDATEAKQDTIIGHLTDIKGAGWTTTDTLEAIRNRGDAAWLTATGFSTHSATDVWSAATRTLTAATNITSDGSAINVSSGVVDTVNLTNTTTTNTDMRGTDSALTDKLGYTLTSADHNLIAVALLDLADAIETGYTLRQSQRIQLAANAGKLSGAENNLPVIRDINDTKNRISATTDANGNRTAVTVDAT